MASWPAEGLTPYPRPVYRPGHHTRHALAESFDGSSAEDHRGCGCSIDPKVTGQITVKEMYKRLAAEQSFVQPIRQLVYRNGSRPWLEQIDIYGRKTNLGRVRRMANG